MLVRFVLGSTTVDFEYNQRHEISLKIMQDDKFIRVEKVEYGDIKKYFPETPNFEHWDISKLRGYRDSVQHAANMYMSELTGSGFDLAKHTRLEMIHKSCTIHPVKHHGTIVEVKE